MYNDCLSLRFNTYSFAYFERQWFETDKITICFEGFFKKKGSHQVVTIKSDENWSFG
jgi:hypothetical protein